MVRNLSYLSNSCGLFWPRSVLCLLSLIDWSAQLSYKFSPIEWPSSVCSNLHVATECRGGNVLYKFCEVLLKQFRRVRWMKPAWNAAAASSGNGRGAVKVYPSESIFWERCNGHREGTIPVRGPLFLSALFPLFLSVDRYAGSCWVMPKNSSGLGKDNYCLLASPLGFFEVTVDSRGSSENKRHLKVYEIVIAGVEHV